MPARHDDEEDTDQHARAAIAGYWNGLAPAPIPARTGRQRHDRPQQEHEDGHAHARHLRPARTRSVELRDQRDYAGAPYHPIDSQMRIFVG